MKQLLRLFTISLLVFGCSKGNQSGNSISEDSNEEQKKSSSLNSIEVPVGTKEKINDNGSLVGTTRDQNKVVDYVSISNYYATSTALPFSTYGASNLFDGDLSTTWKTVPGSGPEEGVMIYFNHPVNVFKIKALDRKGDFIKGIQIYANASNYYGDEVISNLFLKANDSYQTKRVKVGDSYVTQFDENSSFEVAEIRFYDQEDKPIEVVLPQVIVGTVKATSSLSPEVAYGAPNVWDSKKEDGWAYTYNGKDEALIFQFDKEITLNEIRFWNGYQRSIEHFSANASIKKAILEDDKGAKFNLVLIPTNGEQVIKLDSAIKTSSLKLIIKDIYKGEKYNDVVLSEIQFINDDVPYRVIDNSKEEKVQANRSKENPLLKKILDRNLNSSINIEEKSGSVTRYMYKTNSILLRSNNTFVLYERESEEFYSEGTEEQNYMDEGYEGGSVNEVIGDGSWEIKSIADNKLVIRIFGKKYSPLTSAEIYRGEVTNNSLKIFQDFITITPQELKGKTVVSKIPL